MLSIPMNTCVHPARAARLTKSGILCDWVSTWIMNWIGMCSSSRRRISILKTSRQQLLRAKLSSVKK